LIVIFFSLLLLLFLLLLLLLLLLFFCLERILDAYQLIEATTSSHLGIVQHIQCIQIVGNGRGQSVNKSNHGM